jgi:pimeloyl-ACP methyl ester carboxylesterase
MKASDAEPQGQSEPAGPRQEATLVQLGPLNAEVRGQGPTLVALHGNGEDARVFDQVLPYLDSHRLLVLEARGHGRTPAGKGRLTIAGLAQDAANALTAAAARGMAQLPAVIIGFSDGANVAMTLAVEAPALVRGLVLIGGNYRPSGVRLGAHSAMVATWLALRAAGLFWPRARRRARVWGLMIGQPRIAEQDLARIAVPALVVAGEHDLIRRRHTERLARLIPGATAVIVPRQGHMLPVKAPDTLGRLALGFLRGLGPSGPSSASGPPDGVAGP